MKEADLVFHFVNALERQCTLPVSYMEFSCDGEKRPDGKKVQYGDAVVVDMDIALADTFQVEKSVWKNLDEEKYPALASYTRAVHECERYRTNGGQKGMVAASFSQGGVSYQRCAGGASSRRRQDCRTIRTGVQAHSCCIRSACETWGGDDLDPKAIEQEALRLSLEDRAQLAQKLLLSLEALSEKERDDVWLMEANRRARELDQGEVQPASADEVRQKVRALLR